MSQVTIVQVDFSSQEVIGLFPMDPRHVPDAPQGSYYLVPGVDFPATTIVAMGQLWDGTRDPQATGFADPAPVDPATLPTTQTEALDAAEAALREGLDLIAQARALG
ncbi:hypothetical protein UFOVP5_16 [uncultured Caudovirales phage]|uniref:Uncharacterized protein n=1 Tax=uncultured Caudovirales phage TaxID=2100421 RepID=A0A6J5KKQ3_9CAUD|nr:hypothetical protein UFOVP5_16 [uncultured Caudovirales phage]